MTALIYLEWKIKVVLPEDGPDYRTPSKLFELRPGGSILHTIGGGIDRALEPVVLYPTQVFYDAIRLKARALGFEGEKFPFVIAPSGDLISSRVNLQIRLFGSRTILLTVRLDPMEMSIANFSVDAIPHIGKLPNLLQLAKLVLGLVVTGTHKKIVDVGDLQTFPCVAVILQKNATPISDRDAIRFLTHHKDPNDRVVAAVLEKNLDHQVDNNSLLLDRLGIFLRATGGGDIDGSLRRFKSASALLELIVGIESILRRRDYADASIEKKNAIWTLIQGSNRAVPKSTTTGKMLKLLVSEFQLKESGMVEPVASKNNVAKKLEVANWVAGILATVVAILGLAWGIWIYHVPNSSETSRSSDRQAIQGSGNTVIQGSNNTIVVPAPNVVDEQTAKREKKASEEGTVVDRK